MLHEFLTINRADLIERCRLKVVKRLAPKVTDAELAHGIPAFLDQLIKTLRVEQTSEPMRSRKVSGPAGGGPDVSEIGATAALHGRELSLQGFTVEQVVHDYGDLCQAITDLAFESGAPIEIDEFRTLNRCLDNGIADAVTEYAFQRNSLLGNNSERALNERLGFLAHELRNHLHCGGLPPGAAEDVFLPFKQSGADRSGLGLGLAICRRGVEANNGILRVRNVPGVGCVFTIDLPRHKLA